MSLNENFHTFCSIQADWSHKTFGSDTDRGPIGALKHLQKEVIETLENSTEVDEYVDCFFLIIDAARRAGFDSYHLLNNAWAKLAINQNREWPKPTSDEPVEHVRN